MKNAFYFMLQTLSVLEIFTFLSCLFCYVEKWLDEKAVINFNIYDVTDWKANNDNTHITHNQTMKFVQLIKLACEIFFFNNHAENKVGRLVPDLFLIFKKALCKVTTSGQHLSFNLFL